MDCHKAKQLIQQRLDESPGAESNTVTDWTELDTHLAACAECATGWEEMQHTRALLQSVASDKPTAEEKENMWNAIAIAAPGGRGIVARFGGRRMALEFAAASVGIAAVLMVALQVGHSRFGGKPFWHTAIAQIQGTSSKTIFENVDAPLRAMDYIKGAATSSRVSEAENPSGWGIPGHPNQSPDTDTVKLTGVSRVDELPPTPPGAYYDLPGVTILDSDGDGTADTSVMPSGVRFVDVKRALDEKSLPAVAGRYGVNTGATNESARPVVGSAASASDPWALGMVEVTGPDAPVAVGRVTTYADKPGRSYAPAGLPAREAVEWLQLWHPDGQTTDAGPTVTGQVEDRPTPPDKIPSPRQRSQTRIIKTGTVAIEVESYEEAMERAKTIVEQHRAFVADVSTREQTGGALAGHIVIRVAPDRFEALFDALKAIGRVETENVKAADVTAEYVDLEARIKGLEITEQRLAELIANKSFVDKVSSLLEVEREMNRVRTQIEQLTGRLRVMADRVALSTITLTLREPARTVPSGSLSVEVPTVAEAAKSLGTTLASLGGRLISGETSKRDDGTLLGAYQLQTSVSRFDELLAAIEALGRVERRQVNDRQFDVTSAAWAADAKCNLALMLHERSRQLPSGSLRFEVDELADALVQLTAASAEQNASIISNRTTRQGDGSSVAELQVRVPCGEFGTFVDAIAPLGRTVGKEVSGEAGNIVGGAATSICSLSVVLAERPREVPHGHMVLEVDEFDAARDQLSALVEDKGIQVLNSSSRQRDDGSWHSTFRLGIKTSDMESVVRRFESLGRVASREIAGLGLGDLSQADPDSIGAITLTLAEKPTIRPAPDRAGGSIRKALRHALTGLYSSLGLIAYGLIVIAPWLALVLVPAWLITRVRRKHQRVIANPSNA